MVNIIVCKSEKKYGNEPPLKKTHCRKGVAHDKAILNLQKKDLGGKFFLCFYLYMSS